MQFLASWIGSLACAGLFPAILTLQLHKLLTCSLNIGCADLDAQKRSSLIGIQGFNLNSGNPWPRHWTHVWPCLLATIHRRMVWLRDSTGAWNRSCVATQAPSKLIGANYFPKPSLHWILQCRTATVKFPFRLCLVFNLQCHWTLLHLLNLNMQLMLSRHVPTSNTMYRHSRMRLPVAWSPRQIGGARRRSSRWVIRFGWAQLTSHFAVELGSWRRSSLGPSQWPRWCLQRRGDCSCPPQWRSMTSSIPASCVQWRESPAVGPRSCWRTWQRSLRCRRSWPTARWKAKTNIWYGGKATQPTRTLGNRPQI